MLRDLDELLDDPRKANSIDAGTVACFRKRLADLVDDAARIDRLEAERRAVADLLDRALRSIGLIRRERAGDGDPGAPIEYRYPPREAAPLTLVRLSVPLEGEITVEMLGLGNPRIFALKPDADCKYNLERIIQAARRLGLDIRVAGFTTRDPATGALRSVGGAADDLPQHTWARHWEGSA